MLLKKKKNEKRILFGFKKIDFSILSM